MKHLLAKAGTCLTWYAIQILLGTSVGCASSANQGVASDSLGTDAVPANCQPPVPPSGVTDSPSKSELAYTAWDATDVWTIDVASCSEHYYRAGLPFGSAWVVVQASGETCRVWLGGETENPLYRGETTQFCKFPLVNPCVASVEVTHGAGGPARITSPGCIVWPQSQNSTDAAP